MHIFAQIDPKLPFRQNVIKTLVQFCRIDYVSAMPTHAYNLMEYINMNLYPSELVFRTIMPPIIGMTTEFFNRLGTSRSASVLPNIVIKIDLESV